MREDWQLIRLDEYLDIQGGSQPPKSNFIYEPKQGYIQLLQIRDFGQKPVPTYVPINMVTKFCEENDVLIARYGASLGRIVTGLKGAYNVALAKVIDNQELFIKKYLFYLLQTSVLQKPLKLISRTAQNGFAKHEIGHVQLPLCSLLEQKAIVAKIEQLFSELDNGIANLKTAQAKLKIYRQAVLKKAFEGELTHEWREKQTNLPSADELLEQIKKEREVHYEKQLEEWKQAVKNGKKQTKPKKQKELNIELNKITLGSLIEEVKYGTSKKCDYGVDGTGVLRIPNIADGYIDNTDLKFAKFNNEEVTQYKLKTGDILIIRSNGSVKLVGKPALINENDTKYLYAGYLIRLRPYQTILNSKYLYYQLISHELRKQIEEKAKSTSGVNNINSGEIESLLLSIQSLEEQNQIVQEIESRLSVCDKIEETIETSLAKSEALRQSILKKAFEGKLLSEKELENIKNHPEYESAEELLKRIKKERDK